MLEINFWRKISSKRSKKEIKRRPKQGRGDRLTQVFMIRAFVLFGLPLFRSAPPLDRFLDLAFLFLVPRTLVDSTYTYVYASSDPFSQIFNHRLLTPFSNLFPRTISDRNSLQPLCKRPRTVKFENWNNGKRGLKTDLEKELPWRLNELWYRWLFPYSSICVDSFERHERHGRRETGTSGDGCENKKRKKGEKWKEEKRKEKRGGRVIIVSRRRKWKIQDWIGEIWWHRTKKAKCLLQAACSYGLQDKPTSFETEICGSKKWICPENWHWQTFNFSNAVLSSFSFPFSHLVLSLILILILFLFFVSFERCTDGAWANQSEVCMMNSSQIQRVKWSWHLEF